MYGTSDIEVQNNGDVIVGSGDDARTIKKDAFEKALATYNSTEDIAKGLEQLPAAINSAASKMGVAGRAFENTYMGKEGTAITGNDLATLKQYTNNIHNLGEVYYSLSREE
jgi:ribonuclease D